MKRYFGTKRVEAEPMSRGDYNKYRGWNIPYDENPDDEGYLIQYEDGYISWSPKKQFEESYVECTGKSLLETVELMKSADYRDRFVAEFKQVSIRIDSLARMVDKMSKNELEFTPNCSYELLNSQLNIMNSYKSLLEERARIEKINLS